MLAKSYHFLTSDLTLNMIAFGVVIVTQQLVLLPFIARQCDVTYFANLVIAITVSNILCNVFGGELGNTRMLRNNAYAATGLFGDFGLLLSCVAPIAGILSALTGYVTHFSAVDTSLFAVTAALGGVRLYAAACHRINRKFLALVGQSVAYFGGALLGLFALRFFPYYSIPFVTAEAVACAYSFSTSNLIAPGFTRTPALRATVTMFAQLGALSLLTNLVMSLDRLILYPLLSHSSVAVYYAASAMSKTGSLFINPVTTLLLSRLALTGNESRHTTVLAALKWTTLLLPIAICGNLAVSYVSLLTLYPQYYDASVSLLLPVCLGAAVGDCVFVLRTVLIRFGGPKMMLGVYVLYVISLTMAGYQLSLSYGLWGFVVANVFARLLLWSACVGLLCRQLQARHSVAG